MSRLSQKDTFRVKKPNIVAGVFKYDRYGISHKYCCKCGEEIKDRPAIEVPPKNTLNKKMPFNRSFHFRYYHINCIIGEMVEYIEKIEDRAKIMALGLKA